MSRTYRKILSVPKNPHGNLFTDKVDDSKAKHRKISFKIFKLTPYTKKNVSLYKLEIREVYSYELKTNVRRRTGIGARTSVRNANRSQKKYIRQKSKKIIAKELNEL